MDNMKHRRLQELDRSDFGFVEGEPDIRGWDVKTASGEKIGEVEELIIDAQQGKVRYMIIELDDDDLDLEDDKKVLIPIGLAELDKEDDDVILPSVSVEQLRALPPYDAEYLNDEVEKTICTVLERSGENRNTTSQAMDKPDRKRNAIIIDDTSTEKVTNKSNSANSTDDATSDHSKTPAIGTPEYYASFYQHPHFNDENLSRSRTQQNRSEGSGTDSDYERGLRLWEMRNEGTTASTNTPADAGQHREISDDQQKEMIRSRRAAYEERQSHRKGKSIIDRINEEGMQDAK
jgi:sporulation protein YlmC with PRC-barrel domain